MDWDPFADALKSVRKGSPNVKSQSHPSTNSMGDDPKPDGKEPSSVGSELAAISAKTGKLKKIVRFAGEGELEKVKWIEQAVYEDDGSGSGPYGVHGRSLADLQREEGNLLRHKMLEQVDWVTPSPIAINNGAKECGLESTEKYVQGQREASTLAALYQGAPPDTPVEPPSLASLPMDISDPTMVAMVPGDDVAAIMQSTSMITSLQDLTVQLTGVTLSATPTANATATAPTLAPPLAPAPASETGVGGNLARGPPARGLGNRGVPASQNTRRPLCSFFAKGRLVYHVRFPFLLFPFPFPFFSFPQSTDTSYVIHIPRCRYGEDCDFSHDPAKLAGRQ